MFLLLEILCLKISTQKDEAYKKDFFVFNQVFRDKVSVAINKICLIKLIDQLQFTISSKHVLLTKNDLREI